MVVAGLRFEYAGMRVREGSRHRVRCRCRLIGQSRQNPQHQTTGYFATLAPGDSVGNREHRGPGQDAVFIDLLHCSGMRDSREIEVVHGVTIAPDTQVVDANDHEPDPAYPKDADPARGPVSGDHWGLLAQRSGPKIS